jgi:hypothetical protein
VGRESMDYFPFMLSASKHGRTLLLEQRIIVAGANDQKAKQVIAK